jgi:hypothetical protein
MSFILGLFGGPFKMWIIGGMIAAALAFVGYQVHHQREIGRDEIRAEWAASVSDQRAAALAQSEEHRRIEQRRMSLAAEAQQRKDDAIRALDSRLAAALGELRNRPERPAAGGNVPGNPGAGPACTGAQLYRSDSEFLTREAARAQRILAERDYCHDRYQSLTQPRAVVSSPETEPAKQPLR